MYGQNGVTAAYRAEMESYLEIGPVLDQYTKERNVLEMILKYIIVMMVDVLVRIVYFLFPMFTFESLLCLMTLGIGTALWMLHMGLETITDRGTSPTSSLSNDVYQLLLMTYFCVGVLLFSVQLILLMEYLLRLAYIVFVYQTKNIHFNT